MFSQKKRDTNKQHNHIEHISKDENEQITQINRKQIRQEIEQRKRSVNLQKHSRN